MGVLLKQEKRRRRLNQLKDFLSRPEAFGAAVVIFLWVSLIAFAPLFSTHDPLEIDLVHRLEPPSTKHFMGTDALGRDIFSRLLYGGRATFFSIFLAASLMAPLGLFLGMAAAFFGGATDLIITRVIDLFFALPRLVLALVFVALLGPSLINAVFAIALTSWTQYARLARAETLGMKNAQFVQAAHLQGASRIRILYHYLLPLCASSLLVRLSLDLGGIILSIAAIGFLGLGAKPPSPEWGAMAAEGRAFLLNQWWVSLMPGLAIFSVSLSFNLLGNALRDLIEEKTSVTCH
jgi:peptide/nickel transport system permease protein